MGGGNFKNYGGIIVHHISKTNDIKSTLTDDFIKFIAGDLENGDSDKNSSERDSSEGNDRSGDRQNVIHSISTGQDDIELTQVFH